MSEPATDNGGPAYPNSPYTYPNGELEWGRPGMTLRDYFAGQVLASGARPNSDSPVTLARQQRIADIATFTYEIADAMLAARKVVQP